MYNVYLFVTVCQYSLEKCIVCIQLCSKMECILKFFVVCKISSNESK